MNGAQTTRTRKYAGFTVIELMVVVALLAFIMTMSVPGLVTFTKNNRLVTQVNGFVGAMRFARGQAITRRKDVTICKTDDSTSCGNSEVNWEEGWIVFIDENGNGSVNTGGLTPDVILRVWPALEGGNTLRGNNNLTNRVTYDPNGFTGNNGRLRLCDDRGIGDENAGTLIKRILILSTTGRLRNDTDANNGTVTCP